MWVDEEMKMSDDSIIYCLENLSGYEPEDIECDDVDIAVNDDQFTSMSIVRTAALGAGLARRLTKENARLTELAAQKASRADELFEFVKYVNSMSGCKAAMSSQEFYGITKEAGRIVDKIKQEGNDE